MSKKLETGALPAGNVVVDPRLPHMEVMDMARGDAWLCMAPVTAAQFKSLAVAAPLIKSGFTTSVMDASCFYRSPGADADGVLETRVIGGLTFGRVARVGRFNGLPKDGTPALLSVIKHQALGFDAGRTVEFVRPPDGAWYVELTEAREGQAPATLPPDWKVARVALAAPWSVRLPCPTSAWFFTSLRSYHGPLATSQLPAGLNLT
jgi:hypothetical protein